MIFRQRVDQRVLGKKEILLYLQKGLRNCSFELFIVLHRELSYSEIKNAEVFIPLSAYAALNQFAACFFAVRFYVPMAIQNTARFVV